MIISYYNIYVIIMNMWSTIQDFVLRPDFSIDYSFGESVPENLNSSWKKVLGNGSILMSNERVSHRHQTAKERYLALHEVISVIPHNTFPIVLLVFAESLFWLEDIRSCLKFLKQLLDTIGHDDKLLLIISFLEEYLQSNIIEDELFHTNEGPDRIDGATLFVFEPPTIWVESPYDQSRLDSIREAWRYLQTDAAETVSEEFLRFSCIATNELEGVFELSAASWTKLVKKGFFVNSIAGISKTSKERKTFTIISILKNTMSSIEILSSVLSDFHRFGEAFIKLIHLTLLGNDNFDCYEAESEDGDLYIGHRLLAAGEFRRVACVTTHHDDTEIVQYCHHTQIESQMEIYCQQARELLLRDDIDPFYKAAWLQWAFLRIHPFEDGNGRVARIISSIPLLIFHLPPIVIMPAYKSRYFGCLHEADRNANISHLSDFLGNMYFTAMEDFLSTLNNKSSGGGCNLLFRRNKSSKGR